MGVAGVKRRIRRASARALRQGRPDPSLSGVGGLAAFNAFAQAEGLGRVLRERFGHLKKGRGVVYPMHTQMQLLVDAAVVGAKRTFDFEWLAGDPLFTHLAGGAVPSVDVLYDDLRRFAPPELEDLEALVAEQGLKPVREKQWQELTVDIDTTVMPLFGGQEGALPHPILARIAETNTVLGARLRFGDTCLGKTRSRTSSCGSSVFTMQRPTRSSPSGSMRAAFSVPAADGSFASLPGRC